MTKEKFNELLYKLHNGDRTALEPIFNEYYSSMKAAAFFIVHSDSDAEDAASDAMIRLMVYAERKDINERVDNPGGFMYIVIRSCALNILKRNQNSDIIEDLEVCATEDVSQQAICRYDLIKALNGLTDIERELAIRYFMFGENIKDINKDFDYHYDSLRRKLREIRAKINNKL